MWLCTNSLWVFSGGWVSWGRGGISSFVCWFVFRVFGNSLVLDIGDVAVLIGLVGDDLSATVGEDDAVRTGHYFTIAALLVTKVVVRRLILDGVGKVVRAGRL